MKETFKNLKKVFNYGKKYKWAFLLEMFATIVQIIVGIFLPLLLAKQIVLLTSDITNQIIFVSLGVLLIKSIDTINYTLLKKSCQIFRRNTSKNIEIKLGEEILKLSQSEIEKKWNGYVY